jgi:hypothetical protein
MRTPCAVYCSDSINLQRALELAGHDPPHPKADLADAERRDNAISDRAPKRQ